VGSNERISMIQPILKNSMKKICEKPVDYSSIVVCFFLNFPSLAKRTAMSALSTIILVDETTEIIEFIIESVSHLVQY
jgi:hypothetical protein